MQRLSFSVCLAVVVIAAVSIGSLKAVSAETVKVAFTTSAPPYTFANKAGEVSGREGIWVDVYREALAFRGHTLVPRYIPYNRFGLELESGRIDGVSLLQDGLPPLFASADAIHFKNYVFGHPGVTWELRSLDDLAGRSLVSWQGARGDLGERFAEVSKSLRYYKEIGDQVRQVMIFLGKRVELTIVDTSIFRYVARIKGFDPNQYIPYDIIGGVIRFPAGFASEKIRNDFNEGLEHLKSTGRYEAIYDYYINEYSGDAS